MKISLISLVLTWSVRCLNHYNYGSTGPYFKSDKLHPWGIEDIPRYFASSTAKSVVRATFRKHVLRQLNQIHHNSSQLIDGMPQIMRSDGEIFILEAGLQLKSTQCCFLICFQNSFHLNNEVIRPYMHINGITCQRRKPSSIKRIVQIRLKPMELTGEYWWRPSSQLGH